MKRSALILITWMLSNLFSFSQTTLPNLTITGSDTNCIVSIRDVRSINHIVNDLDACNELADSLYSQIENYSKLAQQKNEVIITDELIISKQEQQLKEKEFLENSYKEESVKNGKKIKRLKVQRNITGVISITSITLLILLL